ncbi:MAG TPA: hypothetical protein VK466_06930 [Terriglobales bacterium]|nr:hypothetical protein [Terriglobales bacterium]
MIAITIGAAIAVIVGVVLFLWANDVRQDRQHVLIIEAPTPLFVGTGGDGRCEGTKLTTVDQGSKLPVRRIRYLKNCAAVDVVLPDGRKGYVVLGVGHAVVDPSLPTI